MECQFAFICDYAVKDRKLHAIGVGWDTIYTPTVPAVHATMCLVAKLRGSVAEAGKKQVELRLLDSDGTDIIPTLAQEINFQVRPPNLQGVVDLVFNLVGVQFPNYGDYGFYLVVNGTELHHIPFRVAEVPTTV